MYNQDTKTTAPAGFFVRLAAYLLDHIILFFALGLLRFPLWLMTNTSRSSILTRPFLYNFTLKHIIFYLLTVAYFVLMVYLTGTSLGKRAFRIKVISSKDEKLGFFSVVYRETIGRYLSSFAFIGYFFILADKKKQALHDKLADTMVVYSMKAVNDSKVKPNDFIREETYTTVVEP